MSWENRPELTRMYAQLEAEIAEAKNELKREYLAAVRDRGAIKGEMNDLERKLSAAQGDQASRYAAELRKASKRLNELCDSLCLASKGNMEKVRELKERAETAGLDLSALDEVRATAKRIEEVASDLLCFSLGR